MADEEVALVPFNHASPFHNPKELPERTFFFLDKKVVVKQSWVGDGRGGTELGFGAAVYEAGFLLADLLALDCEVLAGKDVLELGCGVGLVSITCGVVGRCKSVVATDGDIKSVRLCKANCAANGVQDIVQTKRLRWGVDNIGRFDIIVGSDVVCHPYRDHFESLRKTLLAASKPGAFVYITHKPRDPCEKAFLDSLCQAESEFDLVQHLPPERLHADFVSEGISAYIFRRRMNQNDLAQGEEVKPCSHGITTRKDMP